MSAQYRIELGALEDLESSVDYLLADRPDVAPRFVDACRGATLSLHCRKKLNSPPPAEPHGVTEPD